MKKIYLFFLFVLMSGVSMAHVLKCPEDIKAFTDGGVCTAKIDVPQPVFLGYWNTQVLGLYYELSGATTGSGMYPTTGPAVITFKKGVTTVKLIQKYRDWVILYWWDGSSECSFLVTVEDKEKPTFTCVSNQMRKTDAGICTYKAIGTEFNPTNVKDNCEVKKTSWTAPGATPASGDATLTGTVFPKGITTVTWKVEDTSSNTNTCSFTVTVQDKEPPVIGACGKTYQVYLKFISLLKWQGELPVSSINSTITDNCGTVGNGITVEYSRTLFWVPGYYIVTVTATDAAGNITTCKIKVVVNHPYLKSGNIGQINNLITDVVIYPNPTNGRFSVDIKNLKNQEVIVKIYNMAGSMVMDRKYSTEGHIDLDMTGKTNGVYLLKVIADEQEFIERFILKEER